MRAALAPLFAAALLSVALPAAQAQTAAVSPPPDIAQPPLDPRSTQRVEHIRTEDMGSRVDEVRYGGKTERITVQPKSSTMPAYEVQPINGSNGRRALSRDDTGATNGSRVWNVMPF